MKFCQSSLIGSSKKSKKSYSTPYPWFVYSSIGASSRTLNSKITFWIFSYWYLKGIYEFPSIWTAPNSHPTCTTLSLTLLFNTISLYSSYGYETHSLLGRRYAFSFLFPRSTTLGWDSIGWCSRFRIACPTSLLRLSSCRRWYTSLVRLSSTKRWYTSLLRLSSCRPWYRASGRTHRRWIRCRALPPLNTPGSGRRRGVSRYGCREERAFGPGRSWSRFCIFYISCPRSVQLRFHIQPLFLHRLLHHVVPTCRHSGWESHRGASRHALCREDHSFDPGRSWFCFPLCRIFCLRSDRLQFYMRAIFLQCPLQLDVPPHHHSVRILSPFGLRHRNPRIRGRRRSCATWGRRWRICGVVGRVWEEEESKTAKEGNVAKESAAWGRTAVYVQGKGQQAAETVLGMKPRSSLVGKLGWWCFWCLFFSFLSLRYPFRANPRNLWARFLFLWEGGGGGTLGVLEVKGKLILPKGFK